MSIFSFISDMFTPVSDIVDELNYSGEEKALLRNKLAEIEAKVATKTLSLQSQIIEANSKVAMAEQEHGNWYVKSIRPTISLGNWLIILLMSFGKIPYNEYILIACGGYNAHYTHLRSQEKKAGVTR